MKLLLTSVGITNDGTAIIIRRCIMVLGTMWQRHANPWSGWTRSLTQPLLCVPLWTRSWKQGAALTVWLAVNPVLFPPPQHDHAWMTRAIRGEHM